MPPHDDDEWPQNHKSILRGQECAAILREKNMETVGNFSLTTVTVFENSSKIRERSELRLFPKNLW